MAAFHAERGTFEIGVGGYPFLLRVLYGLFSWITLATKLGVHCF